MHHHKPPSASDVTILGVISNKGVSGLFVRELEEVRTKFYVYWSEQPPFFTIKSKEIVFKTKEGKKEDPRHCSHFSFSETDTGWYATYTKNEHGRKHTVIATSTDAYNWHIKCQHEHFTNDIAFVPATKADDTYKIYHGGLFIKVSTSTDLKRWEKHPELLFTSRAEHFDDGPLHLMGSTEIEQGHMVVYDATRRDKNLTMLQAGIVIFDKHNPAKIIWRSSGAYWKGLVNAHKEILKPVGLTRIDNEFNLYWASAEGTIIRSALPIPHPPSKTPPKKHYLRRHHANPVITPHSRNKWENQAVFNPAAIYDNGRIHLLYRAIGESGVSVLGYASSEDGFTFDTRHEHPAYEPNVDYLKEAAASSGPQEYDPNMYTSGGGWNGFEDPRAVKIDNRIYVTYLDFGGWHSMRMAVTSIDERDFHKGNWKWTAPQYISPPGQVNKNWVLFPEKINGKFAILHSISPKILIDYVDDLEYFDGKHFIQSRPPRGGRLEYWDSRVRGAGPPPIKTKLGWLVLYHANDEWDPSKYKLGAMVLDADNPTKILHRTSHPILTPDMPYENDGKPGIVYASGAVVVDNTLFVYYGGGDKVVCVASAPLDEFLESIKKDKGFAFKPRQSLVTLT